MYSLKIYPSCRVENSRIYKMKEKPASRIIEAVFEDNKQVYKLYPLRDLYLTTALYKFCLLSGMASNNFAPSNPGLGQNPPFSRPRCLLWCVSYGTLCYLMMAPIHHLQIALSSCLDMISLILSVFWQPFSFLFLYFIRVKKKNRTWKEKEKKDHHIPANSNSIFFMKSERRRLWTWRAMRTTLPETAKAAMKPSPIEPCIFFWFIFLPCDSLYWAKTWSPTL